MAANFLTTWRWFPTKKQKPVRPRVPPWEPVSWTPLGGAEKNEEHLSTKDSWVEQPKTWKGRFLNKKGCSSGMQFLKMLMLLSIFQCGNFFRWALEERHLWRWALAQMGGKHVVNFNGLKIGKMIFSLQLGAYFHTFTKNCLLMSFNSLTLNTLFVGYAKIAELVLPRWRSMISEYYQGFIPSFRGVKLSPQFHGQKEYSTLFG